MKKSNKRYLFIFIVIILFSLTLFIILGPNSLKKEKMKPTIIIDNDSIFEFDGNRWGRVDTTTKIDNLNWKKFNVYIDNESYGKFYLVNQGKWYLFDDDKNAINYESSLLAVDTNNKYKVVNIKRNSISDFTYIHKVLAEYNLDIEQTYTSSDVIEVDIDNDNKNEYIYTITNKFPDTEIPTKSFGFIFMVKNNKIYYLYDHVSNNEDIYDGCKPYINNIIDINQDNKYEFIISCSYYSNNGVEQKLYEFNNSNFNLLVSN